VTLRLFVGASCTLLAMSALADTAESRCDLFKKGEDRAYASVACTFSQRQGAVGIELADGTRYDLAPTGDDPGTYRDAAGRPAYRESGLGDQGQIYRLHDISIFVYWDAQVSESAFDATTLLPCTRATGESGQCPAGILRMDGGQASLVITDPDGEELTINFMTDYVNAANHKVDATLSGDTWTVVVDDDVTYTVPMVAIEGD
jgi:hypothetical protein